MDALGLCVAGAIAGLGDLFNLQMAIACASLITIRLGSGDRL